MSNREVMSDKEVEVSEKAIKLLYKVPYEEEGPSALAFLSEANDILEYANRENSQDIDEAVSTLEELASLLGPVTAWIQTRPPGNNVWYRRSYQQANQSNFVVTSDDSVFLSIPSTYYFWTIHPETGDTVEHKKDCRRGCHAVLDLRN